MERVSRETWAKRVERWGDSGLTAKEYAAELGINAQSLAWWKWRLSAQTSTTTSSPARGRARRTRAARTAPVTTPLTFVELPSAAASEPLEIVLPSSVRIRVPAAFDAAALGRLLDVLGHRP